MSCATFYWLCFAVVTFTRFAFWPSPSDPPSTPSCQTESQHKLSPAVTIEWCVWRQLNVGNTISWGVKINLSRCNKLICFYSFRSSSPNQRLALFAANPIYYRFLFAPMRKTFPWSCMFVLLNRLAAAPMPLHDLTPFSHFFDLQEDLSGMQMSSRESRNLPWTTTECEGAARL